MQMLKAYAKDFWRYRYLLQNLIGRDFKLKYRRIFAHWAAAVQLFQ